MHCMPAIGSLSKPDLNVATHNRDIAALSKRVYARRRGGPTMGELLAMIIIPPLVGIVTYVVLHLLWKKQEEEADRIEQQHQLDVK
jgi:hypothetical protein